MSASRRVEVLGGTGTVHREPGLVCWFAPGFSPDLAAAVLEVARSAGIGDADRLARRLEAAQAGSRAAVCVIHEGASSLSVTLWGHVVLSEDGVERLRGSEEGGIMRADVGIEANLTVRGDADPDQIDRPGCVAFDLRDGTVPGGGVTFWPCPSQASTDPDERTEVPRLVAPFGRPLGPANFQPTKLVNREAAAPEEQVPNAGAVSDTPAAAVATTPERPRALTVRGVNCARGHFNNPRALYCGNCGLAMVQNSVVIVDGPRPSLGVLLRDDGSAYSLDGDYVLGRQPELAEDVAAGRAPDRSSCRTPSARSPACTPA